MLGYISSIKQKNIKKQPTKQANFYLNKPCDQTSKSVDSEGA